MCFLGLIGLAFVIFPGQIVSWFTNDPAVYDEVAARARLAPGERVACFRERMIASTVERGDWNYFGTHRCALEGAHVSGGSLAPGDRGDLLDDGVRDAPVGLVGKLVDIRPTATGSTTAMTTSRWASRGARTSGPGPAAG